MRSPPVTVSRPHDFARDRPAPKSPVPQMRLYRDWLARERGLSFADYAALWAWSTSDLEGFWRSIWDYHGLTSPTPFTALTCGW